MESISELKYQVDLWKVRYKNVESLSNGLYEEIKKLTNIIDEIKSELYNLRLSKTNTETKYLDLQLRFKKMEEKNGQ
jgi:chromosome segregation ATPase